MVCSGFQTVASIVFGAAFLLLALDVVAWSKQFSPSSLIALQNNTGEQEEPEAQSHDCFDRRMLVYIVESLHIVYVLIAKLFLGMTVFSMVCEIATLMVRMGQPSNSGADEERGEGNDGSQPIRTRTTIHRFVRITSTVVSTAIILCTFNSFTPPSPDGEWPGNVSLPNKTHHNNFYQIAHLAHSSLTFVVTLFVLTYGLLISCVTLVRTLFDENSNLRGVDVLQNKAQNAWKRLLVVAIFVLLPLLSVLYTLWNSWGMFFSDIFQPSSPTKDYLFCSDNLGSGHYFSLLFMFFVVILYFPIIALNVAFLQKEL